MNSISESIIPSAEDITCQKKPDGSLTLEQGPTTVTFSSLEMAQIERGLVSTDAVRSCISEIFTMGKSLEKALGSESQKRLYRQCQTISQN